MVMAFDRLRTIDARGYSLQMLAIEVGRQEPRSLSDSLPRPQAVPIIEVSYVYAGYDQDPVFEDVSLTVSEGDFIGLIGPNGDGKTTFFKILLGLLAPWQGHVQIMGGPVQRGGRYMGYVPQHLECDRSFPITVWAVRKRAFIARALATGRSIFTTAGLWNFYLMAAS